MRFYDGSALEDAYSTYGVDPARGALVVFRPDGYVGDVASLNDIQRVDCYLRGIIKLFLVIDIGLNVVITLWG